ncbi:MAG: hypothetical protein HYX74_11760 [Acidobacteria bacterium]|nr:hypothetical protein [Acidobacteriota bacterium]
MTRFFAGVTAVFDLLFAPLQKLDPIWSLLAASLLFSLLALAGYRCAADAGRIRRLKDRIAAHILEVRLFQDSLPAVARACVRILGSTSGYLAYSLRPLGVLALPMGLFLIQLDLRFASTPLPSQKDFLLKARLVDAASADRIDLRLPDGLTLSAPPLWIPAEREIDWRVRARRAGDFVARVAVGDRIYAKEVRAGSRLVSLAETRRRGGWLESLWRPGEAPLPDQGALESIELDYPPRSFRFLGFDAHWIFPFLVFSLAAVWLLKGLLRAEI